MARRLQSERRQKPENALSTLLSNSENEQIFNIMGNKCVSLATAVVQVFLADQTSGNSRRWNKRCTGVLTLVKDNESRSYFFRVYNLKHRQLEWEQEMYTTFKYKEPRDQFHTFEADSCSAGLCFASLDEAKTFALAVDERLKKRIENRRTKRATQMRGGGGNQPSLSISGPQSTLPATPAPPSVVISPAKTVKNKSKAAKGKKLTKEDISTPSDFRHVNHVGWDPNSGFDVNNLDKDMKSLFERAGISNELLQDDETRKKIYDLIDKEGGLDAVKQQVNSRPPPPAVSPATNRAGGARELPPPPPRHGSAPPPPPTRELPAAPSGAPPPPSRNRPRAAAPSMAPPPPPPAGNRGPQRAGASLPPPPPPAAAPAPPPPPPAGVPAPPPPPPPPPMSAGMPPPPPPSGGGGRGDLLADIQSGRKLREAPSGPPPAAAPSGRDALLDAIKKGRELKHVDPSKQDHSPPPEDAVEGEGNLLNALKSFMVSRNQAINPSDDSDEEEDDDDDWDDDD